MRIPFDTSNDPAYELEPVPEKMPKLPKTLAVLVRLPEAWIPRLVLREPEKEDEPVFDETNVPLVLMLPPMEAVFPTSKLVEIEATEAVS